MTDKYSLGENLKMEKTLVRYKSRQTSWEAMGIGPSLSPGACRM